MINHQGKRAIYYCELRRNGESLLESRLFGYSKGAHNMAFKDTLAFFEDAHNGTIF